MDHDRHVPGLDDEQEHRRGNNDPEDGDQEELTDPPSLHDDDHSDDDDSDGDHSDGDHSDDDDDDSDGDGGEGDGGEGDGGEDDGSEGDGSEGDGSEGEARDDLLNVQAPPPVPVRGPGLRAPRVQLPPDIPPIFGLFGPVEPPAPGAPELLPLAAPMFPPVVGQVLGGRGPVLAALGPEGPLFEERPGGPVVRAVPRRLGPAPEEDGPALAFVPRAAPFQRRGRRGRQQQQRIEQPVAPEPVAGVKTDSPWLAARPDQPRVRPSFAVSYDIYPRAADTVSTLALCQSHISYLLTGEHAPAAPEEAKPCRRKKRPGAVRAMESEMEADIPAAGRRRAGAGRVAAAARPVEEAPATTAADAEAAAAERPRFALLAEGLESGSDFASSSSAASEAAEGVSGRGASRSLAGFPRLGERPPVVLGLRAAVSFPVPGSPMFCGRDISRDKILVVADAETCARWRGYASCVCGQCARLTGSRGCGLVGVYHGRYKRASEIFRKALVVTSIGTLVRCLPDPYECVTANPFESVGWTTVVVNEEVLPPSISQSHVALARLRCRQWFVVRPLARVQSCLQPQGYPAFVHDLVSINRTTPNADQFSVGRRGVHAEGPRYHAAHHGAWLVPYAASSGAGGLCSHCANLPGAGAAVAAGFPAAGGRSCPQARGLSQFLHDFATLVPP
ncbi:hypothetical protein GNI_021950, partial [Gregarina niphandrodes]